MKDKKEHYDREMKKLDAKNKKKKGNDDFSFNTGSGISAMQMMK